MAHERTQQEIEEMQTALDCERDDVEREANLKAFIEAADVVCREYLELSHSGRPLYGVPPSIKAYDALKKKIGGL